MVIPVTTDLVIQQGANFTYDFVWTDEEDAPVDLDDFTARMQIRKYGREIGAPALVEITDTAGIDLGDDGAITLALTVEQTSAIPSTGNGTGEISHVYDLFLTDTGNDDLVYRVLEGRVRCNEAITHDDAP